MLLRLFWLILRARIVTVVSIFVLVVIGAVAASLVIDKRYTAAVSIIVDSKLPDPLMGAMLPTQMQPGYMATQIDIINSIRVAEKVVQLLKLDESPDIQAIWKQATGGRGNISTWLAASLRRSLEVTPSRESNVLIIGFSGKNPDFVANIANAFSDAYIETTIELKVEPAKLHAKWFDERIKGLRENLEVAQKRLSDYQQEHGIIVTDDRLDMEVSRLAELNDQLLAVQGERVNISSRQSQTKLAESLPEVLGNTLIANLRSDLARQEAELNQLASRLGSSHPQYRDMAAQVATLKQRLNIEIQRIVNSIGTEERVSLRREADIKAEVDSQKAQVLALRAQRNQIAVLQRDVESAQRAYDLVGERLTQALLESQAQQTNVAVLSRAEPPLNASSPRLFLNTIFASFVGIILGAGVALILELLDRRVRTEEQLSEMESVPVLGVIPRGDGKKLRRSGMGSQLAVG